MTLKVKVLYSLTLVAQTTMMMSAKLVYLLSEEFFAYLKQVSLVDIHGSNHVYDGSEYPTSL